MRSEINDLAHSVRTMTTEVLRLLLSDARHQASWSLQFRVNCWRFWISLAREKSQFCARVAVALLLSLMIGAIFFRLDRKSGEESGYDQTNVLNVNGALFSICVVSGFMQCYMVLTVLPPWIPVLLRDYDRRMYSVGSFYLALSVVEIPVHVVLPLLLISIDYWMVGLRRDVGGFLVAAGIVVLSANTAASFGHLMCTATRDGASGMIWAGSIMLPLLLVAGFVLNDGSVLTELSWVRYFSWYRHAHELLMVNQWSDVTTARCPGVISKGENKNNSISSSSSSSNSSNGSSQSRCMFSNGTDVLEQFHFSAENNLLNYLLLAAMLVMFRAAAFVSLLVRARRSRV